MKQQRVTKKLPGRTRVILHHEMISVAHADEGCKAQAHKLQLQTLCLTAKAVLQARQMYC